jgi:hypothetical protein
MTYIREKFFLIYNSLSLRDRFGNRVNGQAAVNVTVVPPIDSPPELADLTEVDIWYFTGDGEFYIIYLKGYAVGGKFILCYLST